jgi:RNA polymerase sigma factor (sigma-70 family)
MRDADFRGLLAQWQAGDLDAAGELCRRYGPYLHKVVRRRLDTRLRQLFDSLDFAQDVWVSFLELEPTQYTFDSPQALLGFLTQVAHNKLAEAYRHQVGTRKRDLGRAVPIAGQGGADEAAARNHEPGDLAIAAEQWERLLRSTPAAYRPVVERLREGYTYDEIARLHCLSSRTVKRIVRRLREGVRL